MAYAKKTAVKKKAMKTCPTCKSKAACMKMGGCMKKK